MQLSPAQKLQKIKREQQTLYSPYRAKAKRLLKRFSLKSAVLSEREKEEVCHPSDESLNDMINSVISRTDDSCCYPLCEDEPSKEIGKRETFCDAHAKQKLLSLLAIHLSMKEPNESAIAACMQILQHEFKEYSDLEVLFHKQPVLLERIKKKFDS